MRSDFRNSEVGDFNLSVENVDFNSNVTKALEHCFDFCTRNEVLFYTLDFRTYLFSVTVAFLCPNISANVFTSIPHSKARVANVCRSE